MHPPAWRRTLPKHRHILGHNQGCQDIADPVHQVGPQPLRLIAFQETLEAPVTHGSNNHLHKVYGTNVHFANMLLPGFCANFVFASEAGVRTRRLGGLFDAMVPAQVVPVLRSAVTRDPVQSGRPAGRT